jgi:hypothetical protein
MFEWPNHWVYLGKSSTKLQCTSVLWILAFTNNPSFLFPFIWDKVGLLILFVFSAESWPALSASNSFPGLSCMKSFPGLSCMKSYVPFCIDEALHLGLKYEAFHNGRKKPFLRYQKVDSDTINFICILSWKLTCTVSFPGLSCMKSYAPFWH